MHARARFNRRRLREARKARDLSQSQLAGRIGAHFTSISDWETGKNAPSGRHVASLCRELGITAEQLYDEEEEEESPDPATDLQRAIDRYVDRKIAAREEERAAITGA